MQQLGTENAATPLNQAFGMRASVVISMVTHLVGLSSIAVCLSKPFCSASSGGLPVLVTFLDSYQSLVSKRRFRSFSLAVIER
jgi:hypothetical protein